MLVLVLVRLVLYEQTDQPHKKIVQGGRLKVSPIRLGPHSCPVRASSTSNESSEQGPQGSEHLDMKGEEGERFHGTPNPSQSQKELPNSANI